MNSKDSIIVLGPKSAEDYHTFGSLMSNWSCRFVYMRLHLKKMVMNEYVIQCNSVAH